ncbi:MAG TPA: GNAT family N-acetyltransferase [Jatrophihabitans sp.]|nr:GNAT family N-acetyltransferase [Jatrophihabitans sp.]
MSEPAVSAAEPASYDEPGRTYASVWFFLGLLLAGFGLDLSFGGGLAHLPGWILAIVLVVGVDLLIVYAARSTKSLRLDAEELRVGDESIGRAEIVGSAIGVDDELPVLGWTTGMPRGMKGVTVRLFDGQDVVIPTRHPDRLAAALGLTGAGPGSQDQDVRVAGQHDLPRLAEIDRRAETVFRMAGYELPELPFPDEELAGAAAIFVVGRPPIGFVRVDEVDGRAHIEELAVIPKWMRQGVGTRLLDRACRWARENDYAAITLITYADVPWNGPYYAARGWAETAEVTPGLAELRAWEQAVGLDAVGRRIVMRRELADLA